MTTSSTERRVTVPRQMCEIRDGRFLEPCTNMMTSQFELVQTLDMRTKTPTRTVAGTWADGRYIPFRVCPFCATELPKLGN